jgi:hypothetical protein
VDHDHQGNQDDKSGDGDQKLMHKCAVQTSVKRFASSEFICLSNGIPALASKK